MPSRAVTLEQCVLVAVHVVLFCLERSSIAVSKSPYLLCSSLRSARANPLEFVGSNFSTMSKSGLKSTPASGGSSDLQWFWVCLVFGFGSFQCYPVLFSVTLMLMILNMNKLSLRVAGQMYFDPRAKWFRVLWCY
jgi:hypothetical protein